MKRRALLISGFVILTAAVFCSLSLRHGENSLEAGENQAAIAPSGSHCNSRPDDDKNPCLPIQCTSPRPMKASQVLTSDIARNLPETDVNLVSAWRKNGVRRQYFDLFAALRLPLARENEFVDLIAARITGETYKDREASDSLEAAIHVLVGPHMNQFNEYEEQLEERLLISHINDIMSSFGVEMSAGQRKALLTGLLENRVRNPQSEAPWENDWDFLQGVAKHPSGLLTAHQEEAFADAVAQWTDIHRHADELISNDSVNEPPPCLPMD